MKSSLSIVASACVLLEANSFVIKPGRVSLTSTTPPSPTASHCPDYSGTKNTILNSVTVGRGDSRGERDRRPRRTPTINEQLELETIRKELIQKYLSLGHSLEDATNEVEYFLGDEERSADYVQMRRVAMARPNDLGIEMVVQFGAAFLVGWMGSWMVHHLDAYQAANQGGLPWI